MALATGQQYKIGGNLTAIAIDDGAMQTVIKQKKDQTMIANDMY